MKKGKKGARKHKQGEENRNRGRKYEKGEEKGKNMKRGKTRGRKDEENMNRGKKRERRQEENISYFPYFYVFPFSSPTGANSRKEVCIKWGLSNYMFSEWILGIHCAAKNFTEFLGGGKKLALMPKITPGAPKWKRFCPEIAILSSLYSLFGF